MTPEEVIEKLGLTRHWGDTQEQFIEAIAKDIAAFNGRADFYVHARQRAAKLASREVSGWSVFDPGYDMRYAQISARVMSDWRAVAWKAPEGADPAMYNENYM